MEKFWLVYNLDNPHNPKKCKTQTDAEQYASEQVANNKATNLVILEAIYSVKRKEVPVIFEPITKPLPDECIFDPDERLKW